MRSIGVVTSARSDYGIYLPILQKIELESTLKLELIVIGMHLSPEFGLTVESIESDGFAFQIEVLYQLKQNGHRGLELPTRFVNRTKGQSKMGSSEVIQFIKMCLSYIGKK